MGSGRRDRLLFHGCPLGSRSREASRHVNRRFHGLLSLASVVSLAGATVMGSGSQVLPAAASGSQLTPDAGPITVSVSEHGFRLSLRLARRAYPRNALVQVQATLLNTNRDEYLIPFDCDL